MKQIIHVLNTYRSSILAGILVGTSYIPFPPWALLFCLVPLWCYWWQAPNWKQVFWSGWISQFLLALVGFHWVAYTAFEFGHFPWPLAFLILLVFASLANLHLVIPGLVFFFLHKRFPLRPWQAALFLPSLTVLIESLAPMIFPWNFGYPWYYSGLPIYQIADSIGFVGLSAVSLLINGWFFWAWIQPRRARAVGTTLLLVAVLFTGLNFLGMIHVQRLPTPNRQLRVALVQGNIGNLEKQIAEHQGRFREAITNTYFRLTREALRHSPVDLIVWPETAFPDYADDGFSKTRYPQLLRAFIKENSTSLLTGAYSTEGDDRKVYNAMFLFNANGQLIAPAYRKSILLAFGEYLPGAQYFSFLSRWLPQVSQFARGPGPTVWSWQGVNIGLQICYEGLFPEFSKTLSDLEANLFFNVTNDSWFGRYFEPYQHLYMTFARAIEFRRPVVRTTNTGISTAVLANGEILQRTPQNQEATLNLTVGYLDQPPRTIYQRFGSYWPWLLLLLIGLSLPWNFSGRRSNG